MDIERKSALQNFKTASEQQAKLGQSLAELRARLADVECLQTKTDLENKQLKIFGTENASNKK